MSKGSSDNVQVAIRVRPQSKREKEMNARCIVSMDVDDGKVYVEDPNNPEADPKEYDFNYALDDTTTQDQLWDKIGAGLLKTFWEDKYNITLFAYGQSGAGKSFSMTGMGPGNPKMYGLIQRLSDKVLSNCEADTMKDMKEFKGEVGMVEIYIDKLYDLFVELKDRVVLKMGITTVKDLKWIPVTTMAEVMAALDNGQSHQTFAPTGLNPHSSRGHTVFTLKLEAITYNQQAKKQSERKMVQELLMNLLDLAGSERSDKVAEIANSVDKETLKLRQEEGRQINLSLSALGNTIKRLGEASSIDDPKKRALAINNVPWRSNQLTHLLKEPLSGNSRTMMIAAISPADDNYLETCSTLNYAKQATLIKTSAKKAEVAGGAAGQAALASAMQEIENLKRMLAEAAKGGGGGGEGLSQEQIAAMKAEQAAAEQALKEEIEAQRIAAANEAKNAAEARAAMERMMKEAAERNAALLKPHLTRLMANTALNGLFNDPLHDGDLLVGSDPSAQIKITGHKTAPRHAIIHARYPKVTVENIEGHLIRVNGEVLEKGQSRDIFHNDRVVFASDEVYRVFYPEEEKKKSEDEQNADDAKYTYEFAIQEANAQLLSKFKEDQAEAERAKKEAELKLKRELEARESELAEFKREQEAKMKIHQESMLQAARNIEKQRKAGQDVTEKLMQLQREKAAWEAEKKQQEADAKKRAAEEEEYKQSLIKRAEQEELARKRNKLKLQSDLQTTIPAVEEANQLCATLKFPTKFAVKLQYIRTYQAYKTEVFVDMMDTQKKRSSLFNLVQFRDRWADMRENYTNHKEKQAPLNRELFITSYDQEQIIGTAIFPNQYIYYCTEPEPAEKKQQVLGNDGKPRATITMSVSALLDHNKLSEEEILAVENISELNLKIVDVEIEISNLSGLPMELASGVRCTYEMPDFVESSLLPPDGSDNDITKVPDPPLVPTEFEAKYSTPATELKVNVAPKINYKRTIRIYNVNRKIIEWWRDDGLIVRVWGRQPPDAVISAAKDAQYDENSSSHFIGPSREDLEQQGTMARMTSKAIGNKLVAGKEAKSVGQAMNRMIQQRLRQQVKQLQDENAALKKQIKELQAQHKG